MKSLIQFSLFTLMMSFKAGATTYIINESKALDLVPVQTEFQLEFKGFQRPTDAEPWKKNGEATLCFGEQNGCYTSVASQVVIIGLPDPGSGQPMIPVTTQYTYGLKFQNPIGEKTVVTGKNMITKKIGNEGKAEVVLPRLTNLINTIDVGAWSVIEFVERQDSQHRIEVRIVKTAKIK